MSTLERPVIALYCKENNVYIFLNSMYVCGAEKLEKKVQFKDVIKSTLLRMLKDLISRFF